MDSGGRIVDARSEGRAGAEGGQSVLRTINEFALRLLIISDRSELAWYVAREVVGRLGFTDCVIYRLDETRNLLCQEAATGAKNPQGEQIANLLAIPVGEGIVGHVAATGEPVLVDDLTDDPRYIPDVVPARSEICVPLLIDGKVVGVIDSEDPRPGHFDDGHLEILTTVAAMTSAKLKTLDESRRAAERAEALVRLNRQYKAEIAERREAEGRLRLSEGRLRQANELAGIGHYVWDSVADRCLYCSEHHARIHGLTPEEYIDRASALDGSFSLTHPEDREAVREGMRRLRHGGSFSMEYRIVTPAGETRYMREIAEPVIEDGRVVREIGVTQDITDLRLAEQETRKHEAWLRAILDNAPIEIVLKDTEGRIMAISRNVPGVMGRPVAEFLGKTTADFLPKHIASIYMDADRRVVETGEAEQLDVREEHADHVRYSLNAKFPLRDADGRITGICSLSSDITAMKEAEAKLAQAQKMEAVGQLTGGIAHDFNNLLAVIQGNAEMLEEMGEDYSVLTQPIMRAAARGSELTQRLLAFSRRQPLRPRVIRMDDLVSGMTSMIERTLGATIEVRTAAERDLWPAVADPGQVENAVLNLAINARDAMPEGGRLVIECANAALDKSYPAGAEVAPGDYVMLAVTDTGSGMPPDVLARAFEPFFTTKEVGQGSGLGLSMVYGFAKQSGGHVTLYSEEGKGTTVRLFLPRASVADEASRAHRRPALPRGRGETILVLEDDPDVRALAVRMLRSLDYRVIEAEDAAAARAVLAAADEIDLLLSDVVLPGGTSGPQLAREALASRPGLKVIFMSGYPAEAATRNGLLGPGSVLLTKPFQRAAMADALSRALRRTPVG